MLKSYEGIFENGQVTWLAERPRIESARVIVTVLEDTSPQLADTDNMDAASIAWLDADLAGDLPEYDWGEAGIPAYQPVRFVPGEGLVVDEVN
jgi:hypothetical protein